MLGVSNISVLQLRTDVENSLLFNLRKIKINSIGSMSVPLGLGIHLAVFVFAFSHSSIFKSFTCFHAEVKDHYFHSSFGEAAAIKFLASINSAVLAI